MAIPMADDDEDLTTGLTRVGRSFASGVPDIEKLPMKSATDEELYRRSRYKKDQPLLDFNELPKDVRTSDASKNRGGSLNRKQGRLPSKERGGVQMPTWTETRTTRLRRSKALGESKANNKPFLGRHQSRKVDKKVKKDPKPVIKDTDITNNNAKNDENNAKNDENNAKNDDSNANNVNTNLDAEDEAEEDSGKMLMERIRANSRSLRARLSSHTRRHVSDTGLRADQTRIDTRYKTGYNGVYTVHSRRNRGVRLKEDNQDDDVQIEDTTIQLLDDKGRIYNMNDSISIIHKDLTMAREADNSEILHLHTLSLEGMDTRIFEDHIQGIAVDEGHYRESPDQENNDANDFVIQEDSTVYTIHSEVTYKAGNEDTSTPEDSIHPDAITEVPSSEEREQEESLPDTPQPQKTEPQEIKPQETEPEKNEPETTEPQKDEPEELIKIKERSIFGAKDSDEPPKNEPQKKESPKKESRKKETSKAEPQKKEPQKKEATKKKSQKKDKVNELKQGEHVVNQNKNLTIEVEVKELNDSATSKEGTAGESTDERADSAYDQSQSQPNLLMLDDSMEYDSFPVYSEQNLQFSSSSVDYQTPPSETTYPKHVTKRSKRSSFVRPERSQYSRGIYLRKMEHRDKSGSTIRRARSDGDGLAETAETIEEAGDVVEHLGQTRRGGMGSFEKWNTTSSTGDLRESPWDHVSEKERLLAILDGLRAETRVREKNREDLLRRIKQLQNRAHHRREQGEETIRTTARTDESVNQNRCLRSLPEFARRADSAAVREMWRKRYLEAKKITPRLEEECSKLRHELEKLHRELLAKVQAGVWALLTISGKTEKPSNKLSYKIMIARLLQEIEDLSRRVEGTRLKLHTEIKLRAMAEKDVRNLREELLKKKIQVTLTRNQEQATMGNGLRQQYFISAV